MLQIDCFRAGELKKEVCRKFTSVPSYSLIEDFGFDAIDARKIGIEDYPFATNHTDGVLNRRKQGRLWFGRLGHGHIAGE